MGPAQRGHDRAETYDKRQAARWSGRSAKVLLPADVEEAVTSPWRTGVLWKGATKIIEAEAKRNQHDAGYGGTRPEKGQMPQAG